MSDSTEFILAQREEKIAAIREALAVYPDLRIDGEYAESHSLKAKDCDYICCQHTKDGDLLRVGKTFPNLVVMMPFNGMIPLLLFGRLREEHPEVYSLLVGMVAR